MQAGADATFDDLDEVEVTNPIMAPVRWRRTYDQLISPEALTLAVLSLTFVHEKIKGSVRTRLGALAGSVSA
jgi:hypothetical protein